MMSPVANERRAVFSLACLYIFRMLGLFMVLPVLMVYGRDYQGATLSLLGLAMGAYGFTQALLQVPFGLLSDRWGRKPVIALGLALFTLGSVIAAVSDSVYGLIAGRFLQGAGAIASAVMAMVADLTSDRNRTKAMAGIGASIGLAFGIAIILGPLVARLGGLPAVFWLTAVFAALGFLVLFAVVPNPPAGGSSRQRLSRTTNRDLLLAAIKNADLLRLNGGILVLHFVLMAAFVTTPLLLESVLGLDRQSHWLVYLALVGGSFVVMVPVMLTMEKKGWVKPFFLGAVGLLGLMQLALWQWHRAPAALMGCLFLFFLAFNLLEATLPSLLSKIADPAGRGSANGVYATSQFLGAFAGGSVCGLLLERSGPGGVFLVSAALVALWWLGSVFLTVPAGARGIVRELE